MISHLPSLLGTLLLLVIPTSALLAQATQATVEEAVATGNGQLVDQAILANHANPIVAHLAKAMVSGDAHATIVLALKCVKGATDANAIQVALSCARVLGGTFLSEGDIGGWSRQIEWLQTIGFPFLMKSSGKAIVLGGGLDNLNYAELTKLGRPAIQVNQSDVILRLQDVGENGAPIVEIEVNGRKVRALIDTGLSQSLVLSKSTATLLNIRHVATNILLVGSDLLDANDSRSQTDSLGVTTNVRVGPIEAKGLGAIIVEGMENRQYDAAVGLPLLLKLNGFEIGYESLYLYGDSSPICDTGHPFLVANSDAGRRRILFPAVIDGRALDVFFDTGSEGPIAIQGELASNLDHNRTPLVHQRLSTVEADYSMRSGFTKMSLSLLGRQFDNATIRLVPDATKSVPVLVGAKSLPDVSFRIIRSSMTACLVTNKRSHEQNPL